MGKKIQLLFTCLVAGSLLSAIFASSAIAQKKSGSSTKGSGTKGSSSKKTESSEEELPKGESVKLELLDGKVVLETPDTWDPKEASNRMVMNEFRIPADAGEDDPTARITVSAAGGSVEANYERWKGQFIIGDDDPEAKKETEEIGDRTVHFVDICGTFKDTMGRPPFAGGAATKREDYRMLGAIMETTGNSKIFFKVVGPQVIVEKYADGFREMFSQLDK